MAKLLFSVTIERTSDNRQFKRTFAAVSADMALRSAMLSLNSEPEDYYVVSVIAN